MKDILANTFEPGWKTRLRSVPVFGRLVSKTPDFIVTQSIYNRSGKIVAQLSLNRLLGDVSAPQMEIISPDGHSVLMYSYYPHDLLKLYTW